MSKLTPILKVTDKGVEIVVRKAWIYTRVSTEAQVSDGNSLETQKDMCAKWIAEQPHMDLKGVFSDEGISGRHMKRKGLANLLAAIGENDIIVVYSISRLAREARTWLSFTGKLEKKKCILHSMTESVDLASTDGKLLSTIQAAMAEFEANKTRDRTRDALAAKRRKGMLCNGKPRYGYGTAHTPVGVYMYPLQSEQNVISTIIKFRERPKENGQLPGWYKIGAMLLDSRMYPRTALEWKDTFLMKLYNREKEYRSLYPNLSDPKLVRIYELAKAPPVVDMSDLKKFSSDGGMFEHAKYNRETDPGLNYGPPCAGGGVYLPTIDELAHDVREGTVRLDDRHARMAMEKRYIPLNEDAENTNDSVVIKAVLDSLYAGAYMKLSKDMKTRDEKENLARMLLKS